jgi:hypothetical protein
MAGFFGFGVLRRSDDSWPGLPLLRVSSSCLPPIVRLDSQVIP